MRQVRTCDFCGDDAVGVYEPYPASVPGGPRLLLCGDCRDRLSSVVEPLVAEIEGGGSGTSGGSDEPGSAREAGEPPSAGADAGTADRDEPDETGPGAAAGNDAPDPADAAAGADEDDAGADAADHAPAEDDVGESRDAGGRRKGERAGAPPGYRKVMRFLENRQLPMDRAEAEGLAADAYDLEEGTVADAIDHAVQYGRLREVSGQLKR